MQSNDVIEVVTPLGVGAAKLPYSRMWLPFLRALRVYWRRRVAVRHLSSVESPVALFVRRVEIPVVGEGSESGDQRTPPGSRRQSRSIDANRERRDPRRSV